MRLPDFTFPGNTLPSILSRAAEFNAYIEAVNAENFIKAGVSGEGEPRVLPGILDSIEVSDSLLVDDAETDGKSGSVKIISGWADSDVTITLLLIDIPRGTGNALVPNVTRFDCLREITRYFKQMKDGRPRVYTIQHPHLKAWGVQEFLFNSLKSSESRGKRIITCTLEFDEFDGVAGKSQDRQLGAAQSAADAQDEKSVKPVVSDKTRRGLGELEAKYAKL
ncbi:MAG: hypothetical protein LBO04_02515 [Spirochaetaceae bacterium]|jgi:hypothetical protein|nr:hypothetical protein [Spirochaetaceae bacterium]